MGMPTEQKMELSDGGDVARHAYESACRRLHSHIEAAIPGGLCGGYVLTYSAEDDD